MLCAGEKSAYYKNSFNIAVVAPFFETALLRQFKRLLKGEQSNMAGILG